MTDLPTPTDTAALLHELAQHLFATYRNGDDEDPALTWDTTWPETKIRWMEEAADILNLQSVHAARLQ